MRPVSASNQFPGDIIGIRQPDPHGCRACEHSKNFFPVPGKPMFFVFPLTVFGGAGFIGRRQESAKDGEGTFGGTRGKDENAP